MRRSLAFLLGLAACGKVQSLSDASTSGGDAQPDSKPPTTKVTVTVLDPGNSGAAVTGVPVVFMDSSGTVVAKPPTGGDGTATADLPNGGTITAVIPTSSGYWMKTVLGVKAGDAITLGTKPSDQTTSETFTVTLGSAANAAFYDVYGPCGVTESGGNQTSVQVTVYPYCKEATMDLVAVALDGNRNPLSWVDKSGVAYGPNTIVAMPATWQGFKSFTPTATDIPAEITSVYMDRWWPDLNGYLAGGGGSPTNGTFSPSSPLSGPNSATAMTNTRVFDTSGSWQSIRQSGAGNATAYNLDVGNNLLAWVGRPTLDVTTAKITDPSSGTSHGTPDLFATRVSYSRTGDAGTTQFTWNVYGPDVADVQLPMLPVDVGDVMPRAGDIVSFNASASLFEYDDVSGYDVARQKPDYYVNYFGDAANRASMMARQSNTPFLK